MDAPNDGSNPGEIFGDAQANQVLRTSTAADAVTKSVNTSLHQRSSGTIDLDLGQPFNFRQAAQVARNAFETAAANAYTSGQKRMLGKAEKFLNKVDKK